jgi:type IV pilus assembly protein PilA
MLARIRKAMDENESGFTLIELLVVMIIIGILAAIAIPVFLNQRKNAVDASYKSDLRTVANEMESYYTDNESYPAVAPATAAVGTGPTIGGVAVRVSKNTQISTTYNATAQAFCLVALNTSAKGSHDWVYVSSQGGLQANTVTACPAAF